MKRRSWTLYETILTRAVPELRESGFGADAVQTSRQRGHDNGPGTRVAALEGRP